VAAMAADAAEATCWLMPFTLRPAGSPTVA
jgi:hypothetical protein